MKDGFFEEGDVVQHKVSKQKGIVIEAFYVGAGPQWESYKVSTGFGDPVEVPCYVIELAVENA